MSRTRISFFLTIVWVLALSIFSVRYYPSPVAATVNPKALTMCLEQKKFTMHGEKKCSACAIQKSYFGPWFSRVPYIECDSNRALCDQKNIHAYPTWEDTAGKQYKGAIPLDMLAELAGCQQGAVISTPTSPLSQPSQPPQPAEPIQAATTPLQPSILTRTAIISALLAGFFSFFAPCLLPLYPAYFSVITGFTFAELYGLTQEHIRRRIFFASLVFSAGFTLIFILLGATGSVVGYVLTTYQSGFIQLSGAFLIILGLMQMGVFTSSSSLFDYAWNIQRRMTRLGHLTAFITGIAAALSWIPCVGPLLSSILILTARSQSASEGSILLLCYSLGLTLPFILSGLYFPTVVDMYQSHRRSFHLFSRAAGIFLLCYGILLLSGYYQRALDTITSIQSNVTDMITSWNVIE